MTTGVHRRAALRLVGRSSAGDDGADGARVDDARSGRAEVVHSKRPVITGDCARVDDARCGGAEVAHLARRPKSGPQTQFFGRIGRQTEFGLPTDTRDGAA